MLNSPESIAEEPLKISVVIPVGNLSLYKKNLLDLIDAAGEINAETILVFDGASTEDIHDFRQNIAKKANELIITSVACRNPGGARNAGKALSTGDWITFWDCDDIPNPTKVFSLIREANDLKKDVAIGRFNYIYVDDGSKELSRKTSSKLSQRDWQFVVGLTPGIWRFAFRNSLAKDADFPETRMGEDQVFISRFFNGRAKVYLSNDIVYNYLVGRNSQLTKELTSISEKVNSANILTREINQKIHKLSELEFTLLIKMYLSIFKFNKFPPKVRLENLKLAIQCAASNPKYFYSLILIILREKVHHSNAE
jgi:glycosyltransferase involved in cell wall biosynthesis